MGVVCRLFLGPDGEPVAVPVEDLDAITSFVDEDEEVAGEGIEVEAGGQREEAVEALAHVGRGGGEVDADSGAHPEHEVSSRTARSRRKVSASKPGATAMRRPSARTSSMREGGGEIGGIGSGKMVTGTKWGLAVAAVGASRESVCEGRGE